MENKEEKNNRLPKWLSFILKIAISIACLWYVSGKIDFSKAGHTLKIANWLFLFYATLAFVASKVVAAIRLNLYFKNINIHLPSHQNLKLYWLGMFYNLFLPGSISGDAYKVILLKKKYDAPYKKTSAAVLLDRFSGLLGLGLILAVYSILVVENTFYIAAIVTSSLFAVLMLYIIIYRWMKDFVPSFLPALFLGIVVQAIQVLCVYFIMGAVGIPAHATEYIFIFLVSSVVSVLPLTIGGLGIREIVFLEGSKFFGLLQETSVVISLLFYLITLATSAIGLIYIFNDPLKKKGPSIN